MTDQRHLEAVARMKGTFSAIFTPFGRDDRVNLEMLTRIAEFQIERGIDGFFVAGSTGEGLLLSEAEREQVVRHVVEVSDGRVQVIAHVGHPSTSIASRLAKQAADAGADWIAAIGPLFHGTTFEGAYRHYRQISNATDLPFMMYAFDGQVNSERDHHFFQLPNVCGLKYTGSNYFSVQQLCENIDQEIAVMSGFDEQFVAALSSGLDGAIGSTFNFAPELYAEMYQLFNAGKLAEARDLQKRINKVTALMISQENWSYRKAIMKFIGFDCGHSRPPYEPLNDEQYAAFAHCLRQLDVLRPSKTDW